MDQDDDCPRTYDEMVAAIDADLASLAALRETALVAIASLEIEQAALGQHPNHAAYVHGGLAMSRGIGRAHILAHVGFHDLPFGHAIDRLAAVRIDDEDDTCLLVRLRTVCDSDPLLEIAGMAWLDERGLLKKGALDPFWIKRPALGLGQPAKAGGLGPEHRDGHRGLYTLSIDDLRERFVFVAADSDNDSFGALLRTVIEAGGPELATRGTDAIENDAKARYGADCRSFAAHQRNNGDRRWRWKPPFSRQGHLAVTTARARDDAIPAERTRGHAANWLHEHGANIRFRKD